MSELESILYFFMLDHVDTIYRRKGGRRAQRVFILFAIEYVSRVVHTNLERLLRYILNHVHGRMSSALLSVAESLSPMRRFYKFVAKRLLGPYVSPVEHGIF